MLTNISIGSISLAAAVLINYLSVWYLGWGAVQAQTVAFATWLIGHIFLAVTMRSHREPIWKIGILSNRAMLVWAATALAFLILITNLSIAQVPLNLTNLNSNGWLLAFLTPFIMIFWFEIKKLAVQHAAARQNRS
jgi:Ca2+-transporting ATPase